MAGCADIGGATVGMAARCICVLRSRTILAAAVTVAMALLGVAVIVTGGSVIDENGSTGSDWAFAAFFIVLSLILVPTARFRLRRAPEARE